MRVVFASQLVSLAPFALLLGVSEGAVTSRFQVHIPQSLSKPNGYDHREALFGIPPYGGSIQQQIYYADSNLCASNVDTHKGYPERAKNHKGKMKSWESPYILMVDRGGCTFVQKVRNAQKAGAAAVLIADNTCLCADDKCMNLTNTRPDQCEKQEPIMADDGSGSDITIPSFLLFKHDADPIIHTLKQNQQVRAEMKFSVPAPDSRVEYEIWTAPRDLISRDVLLSFKEAAIALGEHAFFTPHEYVLNGATAGCQNGGTNVCWNLCTNEGKYCALDPDEDVTKGATGADVVAESLRRLCVWDIYGKDGIGKEWWDYVAAFMDTCDAIHSMDTSKFKDAGCIKAAMKKAKVDPQKVQECMDDSGGLEGNVNNTMFQRQQARMEELGVILVPSLFINKAPLRGSLTFETLFEAICAGYATGYEPDICNECRTCSRDMKGCVEHGSCSSSSLMLDGQGVSLQIFAASFLGLTLLFIAIGYIIHQRQQRAMRSQIRGIMAQYMPVDANKAQADNSLGLMEEDGEDGEYTIT